MGSEIKGKRKLGVGNAILSQLGSRTDVPTLPKDLITHGLFIMSIKGFHFYELMMIVPQIHFHFLPNLEPQHHLGVHT